MKELNKAVNVFNPVLNIEERAIFEAITSYTNDYTMSSFKIFSTLYDIDKKPLKTEFFVVSHDFLVPESTLDVLYQKINEMR